MFIKLKMQFVSILFLAACASSRPAQGDRIIQANVQVFEVQFYQGQIQRSSLNGAIMYGPKFESIVKRIVDKQHGKIQECVFQEGKAFLTILNKTEQPLQFEILDPAGFSKGKLIFSDETLTSWSYDIEVIKPIIGKISGQLSDGNGAKIFSDGKMEIKKVWDNKMLIHEIYNQITEDQYRQYLKNITTAAISNVCN